MNYRTRNASGKLATRSDGVMEQFIETFFWHTSNFVRCSTCYPCSAQSGTAPVDSCGHGQETSAPNLHIGSLPTQVRLRARTVSNHLALPSLKIPNRSRLCSWDLVS